MTIVQTLRRQEAVNFDFDGRIAGAEPLCRKASRIVLDPLGGSFT
jgi:hypothetical protein